MALGGGGGHSPTRATALPPTPAEGRAVPASQDLQGDTRVGIKKGLDGYSRLAILGYCPGSLDFFPVQVDNQGRLILIGGGGSITIAVPDGDDIAEGATSDLPVLSEGTGSVSAKLAGLVSALGLYTVLLDYDVDGNLIYKGEAVPGSADTDAVWRIRKFTWTSGNLTAVQWAGGNRNFDNRWDQRAAYAYS